MKNTTNTIVAALFFFSLFISCKKSSEDMKPSVEKMRGMWKIKQVLVNGQDKTFVVDTLDFLAYDFVGELVAIITMGCPKPKWKYACDRTGLSGQLEIDKQKQFFRFTSPSCTIGLAPMPMFVAENEPWKIEKFTSTEVWLKFQQMQYVHETNQLTITNIYEVKLYRI